MNDLLSPYSWQEILDKFPLDYANWGRVDPRDVPSGRIVRDLNDKAGQYGDLLEHGGVFVRIPGNALFVSSIATSGPSSYTVAGITAGTTMMTFTPGKATGAT